MSPNDHNCSWHPSDVTLRLIELFPQLMSSLEMSQQFRRILSLERLLSSTLRAASAGTLGCDYFSSEGVEGEYRYKLTTRGRDAIEFFSVFSPSYGASNSIPSSISAPVDMEARMTDAAAAPASMTTSSSSSSLHYDSDDIQYFDADIEEPNVGEKRKLSSRSSDDEPKRVQPSEKHGVSQEGADSSRPIQHGRSVEQRDPRTGQVIEQFISLRTASEATGVCRRKITDCCARGVNDTPYLWTYANVPSVPNRSKNWNS